MIKLQKNLSKYFWLFSVAVFLLPAWASAFNLSEHRALTNQAFFELNQCLPELKLQDSFRRQVVFKNLEEDLNVFRKDLMYSHFFNPFHALQMFRHDSSVRVGRLEVKFLDNPSALGLGSAIHHIQDMASPPHVVPVMHGLTDGFETFVPLHSAMVSGMNCEQIKNMINSPLLDLSQILRTTSLRTLAQLSDVKIPAIMINQKNHQRVLIGADSFWQQTNEDRFGKYGSLGNSFGKSLIDIHGIIYLVPKAEYEKIKKSQWQLAVQSTLQAMLWSQVNFNRDQVVNEIIR